MTIFKSCHFLGQTCFLHSRNQVFEYNTYFEFLDITIYLYKVSMFNSNMRIGMYVDQTLAIM